MATLNDTSKNVVVVDFDQVEKIIWDYQASHNAVKTLSYGQAGRYAVMLIDSPNGMTWKNGEITGRLLPFYLDSVSPEEEVEVIKTGKISGTSVDTQGKGKLSYSSYARAMEFQARVTVKANWPASDINRWKAAWRLACAFSQGFIGRNDLHALKPVCGMESPEKWDYVLRHFRQYNPETLRSEWEKVKPTEKVNVKPETVKTVVAETVKPETVTNGKK